MKSIAFIGCGHIHTPGFIKMLGDHKDVQVKSVWDHDAARGQSRADELGARFFGDYATIMKDPEISGLIIASETDRHEQLVMAGAAAKKHMFVEKPLGFASSDAWSMAKAIEAAGVMFQTGYFMRGDPALQYLKKQIDAGAFGKITRVRASNCHSGALGGWFDKEWRWMADPKIAGCGAYGDLGTHGLDILLWWCGDVDSATATLSNGTERYPGCDETGEGLLKFKNGVISTLAAGWDDVANPVRFEVSGLKDHAVLIGDKLYLASQQVKDAKEKTHVTDLPARLPHAFELFLDALVGKQVPLVGVREAAYRSAVMEALYKGAQQRAWVSPVKG